MKPWEPQPKESSVAYQAFAEYRDLGPERSLEEVARRLSKSSQLLKRWSPRYSWVARAQAYDAHLDSIRASAREQAVAKQARKIMTADEVLAELTDIAEAPWREFVEVKTNNEGETISSSLRLTDKIRSLELMGKKYKQWVDKVETEDKTPLPIDSVLVIKNLAESISGRKLTDSEASELLAGAFKRAGIDQESGTVS